FQTVGWTFQLLAVWAVTAAFALHVPLPAAALVLLLMNIATLFPLWPGNVGLVMLAREGLSLASLKRMEDDEEASAEDALDDLDDEQAVVHDEPADDDARPYVTQARSRR